MHLNKKYEVIISDSSCLIELYKLSELDLLKKLYNYVTITPEVKKEVIDQFNNILPDWILTKEVKDKREIDEVMERANLHRGESESIALAKEMLKEKKDVILILDDYDARNYATSINLDIVGTIGILIKCYNKGYIESKKRLEEIFKELQNNGFRMGVELLKTIEDVTNIKMLKTISMLDYKVVDCNDLSKYNKYKKIYNEDITGKINHKIFEKAEKSIYLNNDNKNKVYTIEIKEPYKGDKYKNRIHIMDRDYSILEAKIFIEQYENNKNKIENKDDKKNRK